MKKSDPIGEKQKKGVSMKPFKWIVEIMKTGEKFEFEDFLKAYSYIKEKNLSGKVKMYRK